MSMATLARTVDEETDMAVAATKRLNVDLLPELYDYLRDASVEDGNSISDRVRALVELCREDASIAGGASARASQIAAERRRKRAGQ